MKPAVGNRLRSVLKLARADSIPPVDSAPGKHLRAASLDKRGIGEGLREIRAWPRPAYVDSLA